MSETVSIITPTFNSAKYIAETIQSVQKQTYSNWEMIIVDDGSKDTTVGIIQNFMEDDHRIHLIQLHKNSGPAKARNKGIEKAQGDYMTFLDADDIWFPDFIASSIQAIRQTGIHFVFSSYKRSNEN